MSDYVKCPKCGYKLKDGKIQRYAVGTLVGIGKIIGHTGFRMAGSVLGAFGGSRGGEIGGRLGGQAAKYVFGELNNINFVQKKKCPKCGYKF